MIPYNDQQRNVELDEFITPPELIKACIETFWFDKEYPYVVLDPGCNKGQWGEALRKVYPNIILVGVEYMDVPKNSAYDIWVSNQDYMGWKPDCLFDIILGNPPYSVTENGKRRVIVDRWIKHSLEFLQPGAWMFYLLRKGFNHNLRAQKLVLLDNPPVQEYMLLPRPNFFGAHDLRTKGGSGAKWDYSWVSWQKNFKGSMRVSPLFWKGIKL